MTKAESIIRGYIRDALNNKQLERIDQYFVENCILRNSAGREVRGREAFKQALRNVFTSFPDLFVTIDELVIAGNQAAYRITVKGTHQGDFESIKPVHPPTPFTITEAFFVKLEADKIAEVWILMDMHAMLQQLTSKQQSK